MNIRCSNLDTPLHLAINIRDKVIRYKIVELLCKAGANLSFLNSKNKSPIDLAKDKEDSDLVAINANHLFDSGTTYMGFRRGTYLRSHLFEFINMFAPLSLIHI